MFLTTNLLSHQQGISMNIVDSQWLVLGLPSIDGKVAIWTGDEIIRRHSWTIVPACLDHL